MTVEVLKRAGSCLTRAKSIAAANSITNYSAAGLTPPMTFRAGAGHYGNTRALTVKVDSSGEWVVAEDFLADPSPGKP